MRRILAIIAVILYHLAMSRGFTSDKKETTNIGKPADQSYSPKQVISRTPWDMIVDNGKLYIGGGDYNDNTGPVDVYCMDLETKEWSVSGTLNDEAIGKFVRINDIVYAPGFDSKGSNSFGNFYWLEDGQWQENRSIPGAAHNYDIVTYDNKLMFAIGTWTGGTSPVKASEDHGQSFYDIPFYKDNINILESTEIHFMRVYEFFVNDNGLYCIFISSTDSSTQYYEFYKYENEAFHFVSTHKDANIRIKAIKQEPIAAELFYEGKSYIAAHSLSRTSDFITSEELILPKNEIAIDLLIDDDILFVLCAELKEDHCYTRVYAYVYNSFFYPLLSFESENIPISFAKNNNNFYIGVGQKGFDTEIIGSVLTVTVPELTLHLLKDCKLQEEIS